MKANKTKAQLRWLLVDPIVRSQGLGRRLGEKQQQLANQLQKLYEQSASNNGICIVYSTDIYLAEPIM